uniref:NADH dehydrogenase subunit 6 n=1 Tax=Eurythenes maldoror TaxID=1836943 RepID=A0A343RBC4_9CRUS|nr:NADH dehydrogenase subunit 6 [Eurythenes maldoror]ATX68767.1 NADH dehydrogenase subunit 6 [Eurythenes maldoror]
MLMTLLITSFFLALMFMSTSTPLLMALLVITVSATIALLSFLLSKMAWFSFILLMVFISGVMIIFVYISSLASNKMNPTRPLPALMLALLLLTLPFFTSNDYFTKTSNTHSTDSALLTTLTSSPTMVSKLYSPLIAPLTTLLMLYLLLVLLVVVKTASTTKGPLRTKT